MPALLEAVAALDRHACNVTLCLFLDSCTDGSKSIVDRARAELTIPIVFKSDDDSGTPNAGRARRAAMEIGLEVLEGAPRGMLLSTDADSRPDCNWVVTSVAALDRADLAVGVVERDAGNHDPLQARIERYFDRLHALRRSIDPVVWDDGDGRHYRSAANLAISCEAYLAAGGMPSLATGEDARLIDDASRVGLRVRHDKAMLVTTSSRRDGRAVGGLATALSRLDQRGPPPVAPPAATLWQYERQRDARLAFARIDDAATRTAFGCSIGLSGDHVLGVARDCPNAEAFAMRIVPTAPGDATPIDFDEAERQLVALDPLCVKRAA